MTDQLDKKTDLHHSLLQELQRSSTHELEPTVTVERDALGHSQLVHLHPADHIAVEEEEERPTGMVRFDVCVVEPMQDNAYELVVNFDRGTFTHVYRRTVFEGGDGVYETTYSGTFTKEVTGGKGRRKSSSTIGHVSPRMRPATTIYYVCKVDTRSHRGLWEPWDPRSPKENVARLNEAFHQEMLFRSAGSDAVINENVTPPLTMQRVP